MLSQAFSDNALKGMEDVMLLHVRQLCAVLAGYDGSFETHDQKGTLWRWCSTNKIFAAPHATNALGNGVLSRAVLIGASRTLPSLPVRMVRLQGTQSSNRRMAVAILSLRSPLK